MPGFDTLGARLARSRRRLERERAEAKGERPGRDGLDIAIPGEGPSAAVAAGIPRPATAKVIMFPRQNGRVRN